MQTARNTLASCEAQLAQAKATLLNAQEQLSYCTVVSPSDGVVGEIPYRVGSLVSSSTTTPLTTVSNISEMYVYVVDKNSKVASREVKVAPQDDGTNYIVTSGLTKGERIVTEGVTTLEEGMQIKPITKAEEAKKRAEATTKKAETEKK